MFGRRRVRQSTATAAVVSVMPADEPPSPVDGPLADARATDVFDHSAGLPDEVDAGAFISGEYQWVYDHYIGAPEKFAAFVGRPLDGMRLLDVGCGDGLLSHGLTNLPLASVVGLDIVAAEFKALNGIPNRIANAGLTAPDPVALAKFSHFHYDGTTFPFDDESFDVVFSWGAFEHIHQPEQILREMRRVMAPDGFGFVTVFPWYHSRYGSHLSDFVTEPYFHLTRSNEEVRSMLEAREYISAQQRSLVLDHLWDEYLHLNGLSADMFYEAVKAVGLRATKVELLTTTDDLSTAPTANRLSELLIAGCTMTLGR